MATGASRCCNSCAIDQPDGAGDRRQDERGIAEVGQLDEAGAVGELVAHLVGNVERQAGLADAAGAGQRDERHVPAVEQGADGRGVAAQVSEIRLTVKQ